MYKIVIDKKAKEGIVFVVKNEHFPIDGTVPATPVVITTSYCSPEITCDWFEQLYKTDKGKKKWG